MNRRTDISTESLIKLNKEGLNVADMVRLTRMTKQAIYARFEAVGIAPMHGNPVHELVRPLKNKSMADIIKATGLSEYRIKKALKEIETHGNHDLSSI